MLNCLEGTALNSNTTQPTTNTRKEETPLKKLIKTFWREKLKRREPRVLSFIFLFHNLVLLLPSFVIQSPVTNHLLSLRLSISIFLLPIYSFSLSSFSFSLPSDLFHASPLVFGTPFFLILSDQSYLAFLDREVSFFFCCN